MYYLKNYNFNHVSGCIRIISRKKRDDRHEIFLLSLFLQKAFAVYIICLVVIPTNCVTYSLPRFSRGFFEVNNERRTIAGSPNEDKTGSGNRTNEAALILQGILARINRLKKLKEE